MSRLVLLGLTLFALAAHAGPGTEEQTFTYTGRRAASGSIAVVAGDVVTLKTPVQAEERFRVLEKIVNCKWDYTWPGKWKECKPWPSCDVDAKLDAELKPHPLWVAPCKLHAQIVIRAQFFPAGGGAPTKVTFGDKGSFVAPRRGTLKPYDLHAVEPACREDSPVPADAASKFAKNSCKGQPSDRPDHKITSDQNESGTPKFKFQPDETSHSYVFIRTRRP